MTTQDPERLAEKLEERVPATEAEAAAMVAKIEDRLRKTEAARTLKPSERGPTTEKVDREPCAEWWDKCPMYVEIGGTDHWLGSRGMCSPEGETTFTSGFERLTPLGLQVRQILQESAK